MSPVKYALATATILAAMTAGSAQAQEIENKEFDGFYIGGSFGLGAQTNDRNERIIFDTDRNGSFDNNVNTVTGANAFSPGFCNGAAKSNVPNAGCTNDKDDFVPVLTSNMAILSSASWSMRVAANPQTV